MIRYIKLRKIKTLQLDVTTVCQASCISCPRETDLNFDKAIKHHLSINEILKSFSEDQIKQLDKMYLCGNYGEPAAGAYTQDILRYFRKINATITLGMHTNGGLQSVGWWHDLGRILNHSNDYCVFSIDGLEDTNHIYRKNVNWNNIIANAESYISAGGCAQWDMLVYKHNQHQVEDCEKLARKMGFTWFRAKVSKRPYLNGLEAPVGWQPSGNQIGNIECYALENNSVYMDAYGNVNPCCWHGMTYTPNAIIKNFDEIKASWNTDSPDSICQEACSVYKNKTNFKSQWQREIQLR